MWFRFSLFWPVIKTISLARLLFFDKFGYQTQKYISFVSLVNDQSLVTRLRNKLFSSLWSMRFVPELPMCENTCCMHVCMCVSMWVHLLILYVAYMSVYMYVYTHVMFTCMYTPHTTVTATVTDYLFGWSNLTMAPPPTLCEMTTATSQLQPHGITHKAPGM